MCCTYVPVDPHRGKEFEEAVRRYSAALALVPAGSKEEAPLRSNRAAALIRLRRWSDAAADCDAALGIDPGAPKPLWRRGTCRLELGDAAGALQVCTKRPQLSNASTVHWLSGARKPLWHRPPAAGGRRGRAAGGHQLFHGCPTTALTHVECTRSGGAQAAVAARHVRPGALQVSVDLLDHAEITH